MRSASPPSRPAFTACRRCGPELACGARLGRLYAHRCARVADKADYHAGTSQLFAEVGYALGQYGKVGIEPLAGISLGEQRTRGFQERGGFAALRGTLGWRHAFGDVSNRTSMAFEGGQNFTVAGVPLARNTALLGLEAELELSRNAALVLGYKGEFGSGNRDHSAQVRVRWAF